MPDSAKVIQPRESTRAAIPPPYIAPPLNSVLGRSDAQRLQEFRYRFGQSVVFGLPVLALHWFGRSLGGGESDRWVSLFQALLAGWVVYTGAAGMLAEGTLRVFAGERTAATILADLVVAAVAGTAYLISLPHLIAALAGSFAHWPTAFHWCVLLLAAWTGLRWWRTSLSHTNQA